MKMTSKGKIFYFAIFLSWTMAFGICLNFVPQTLANVYRVGDFRPFLSAPITPNSSWIWLKGKTEGRGKGVYGIKGIPSPQNNPGSRSGGATWAGKDGKLYLMGGYGIDKNGEKEGIGFLSDLWVFNPETLEWTWLKGSDTASEKGVYGQQGVSSSLNIPGARMGAATWVDQKGNFYLMGGVGFDRNGKDGYLNDLWKFDPKTLEWTWLRGSNIADTPGVYEKQGVASPRNSPRAREGAVAWTDHQGYFYLMGGRFRDEEEGTEVFLNDLWKFNPQTLEWTWLKGSEKSNQYGRYGTQGVSSRHNTPGARAHSIGWVDGVGNLYLMGGFGGYTMRESFRYPDHNGSYNDLWKFDLQTLEWTWLKGSDMIEENGIYGILGISSPSNAPGARINSISWVDKDGKFYLMGGEGRDQEGNSQELNDVWKFDPESLEWTWIKGSALCCQRGVHGGLGLVSPQNTPFARAKHVSWVDARGNLFIFGGVGRELNHLQGHWFNDLWKLGP